MEQFNIVFAMLMVQCQTALNNYPESSSKRHGDFDLIVRIG